MGEQLREIYFKIKDNKKTVRMIAVVMIIIAAVLFFEMKGNSDTISLEDSKAISSDTKTEKAEKVLVYVDVGGEVKSPGVYKVDKDARIFEVIEEAGGLTKKADTSTINQAESVKDGQKILIPAKANNNETASTGAGTSTSTSPAAVSVININTADSTKLQEIPGVGPVTAEKIIAYRSENGSFQKKEDIKNVSGIGDKTYAKIKNKITV